MATLASDTIPTSKVIHVQLQDKALTGNVKETREHLQERVEDALWPIDMPRREEKGDADPRLQQQLSHTDHVWMVVAGGFHVTVVREPPDFERDFVCEVETTKDDTGNLRFHLMAMTHTSIPPGALHVQFRQTSSPNEQTRYRQDLKDMLKNDPELLACLKALGQVWLVIPGNRQDQNERRSIYTYEPPVFVGSICIPSPAQ